MRNNSNLVFRRIKNSYENINSNYEIATYKGVALKTLFFMLMTVVGAISCLTFLKYVPTVGITLLAVSGIFTLITALISFFSIRLCKITGSLYCFFEGCTLGVLSYVVSQLLEGAVTVALLGTIAVFFVVSTLYVSGIVKVNSGFVRFLSIFAISYIVCMIGYYVYSLITGNTGNIGLTMLVSLITIFLASLYLFFDLNEIRMIVEGEYPKQYEWYASFGLAFTLLWLYVEILKIVVIIFGRRD